MLTVALFSLRFLLKHTTRLTCLFRVPDRLALSHHETCAGLKELDQSQQYTVRQRGRGAGNHRRRPVLVAVLMMVMKMMMAVQSSVY